MSNSNLVQYISDSPHKYKRTQPITKITIHHTAGKGTAQQIANNFKGSRVASSNYCIGISGDMCLVVPEDYRAITSSNSDNDNRAITIEVSNDEVGGQWHVSDNALASLVTLCVDICQRNNIAELNYTGDKNGNLTRHNMFAATACPGPYLQSKFPYIEEQVNRRLEDLKEVVDKTNLLINGKITEVPRILKDGTNYPELRALCAALGFKVDYDAVKKIPIITK